MFATGCVTCCGCEEVRGGCVCETVFKLLSTVRQFVCTRVSPLDHVEAQQHADGSQHQMVEAVEGLAGFVHVWTANAGRTPVEMCRRGPASELLQVVTQVEAAMNVEARPLGIRLKLSQPTAALLPSCARVRHLVHVFAGIGVGCDCGSPRHQPAMTMHGWSGCACTAIATVHKCMHVRWLLQLS